MNHFYIRRQFLKLMILSLGVLLIPINAYGVRLVGELPHEEHFDTDAYASEIIRLSEGATHTWMPNGGWRGGAAKFTPVLTNEGYSGLGQFYNLLDRQGQPITKLNVRFLIYHGSRWWDLGANSKILITNRTQGSRTMVISRRHYASPTDPTVVWESYGACQNTSCTYEGGQGWPDGTDSFRIGPTPFHRSNEWISVEVETDTVTGMIRMYIHTQDGALSGLYVERPTEVGGIWEYIDVIGGYMSAAVQSDPNNYFLFDELKIDNQYIGPPEGFLTDPPPGQPQLLQQ